MEPQRWVDCASFYENGGLCTKPKDSCFYRHFQGALNTTDICSTWETGFCENRFCVNRHPEKGDPCNLMRSCTDTECELDHTVTDAMKEAAFREAPPIKDPDSGKLVCLACETSLFNEWFYYSHIKVDPEHPLNLKRLNDDVRRTIAEEQPVQRSNGQLKCKVCGTMYPNKVAFFKHATGERHKANKQFLQEKARDEAADDELVAEADRAALEARVSEVDGRHTATLLLAIENAGFDAFEQLMGPNGSNMIYIEKCTGASVSMDGECARVLNPAASSGPMRIVLHHKTQEGLMAALPLVAHLVFSVRQDYRDYLDQLVKEDPMPKSVYRHFAQIPLSVEPTSDFHVTEKLMGADGSNLAYIEQCMEPCSVTVHGDAVQEQDPRAEGGPLRVVVRHETEAGLNETIPLVENLVEMVQEEYRKYVDQTLEAPTLVPTAGFRCALCDIACGNEEELAAHCQGILHARNVQIQRERSGGQANAAPPQPQPPQQQPQPPQQQPPPVTQPMTPVQPSTRASSERTVAVPENGAVEAPPPPPESLLSVPCLQELFTSLVVSQVEAAQRAYLNHGIRWREVNKKETARVSERSRDKNYCIVCEQSVEAGFKMHNHLADGKHRYSYLCRQLRIGLAQFCSLYTAVPVPGVDVRAGSRYAAAVLKWHRVQDELPNLDMYAYQELVLLTGVYGWFYCKACKVSIKSFGLQQWVDHVQGSDHAQVCVNLVDKLGALKYLSQYRYVPSPCPCKVAHCRQDAVTGRSMEVPVMDENFWKILPSYIQLEQVQQKPDGASSGQPAQPPAAMPEHMPPEPKPTPAPTYVPTPVAKYAPPAASYMPPSPVDSYTSGLSPVTAPPPASPATMSRDGKHRLEERPADADSKRARPRTPPKGDDPARQDVRIMLLKHFDPDVVTSSLDSLGESGIDLKLLLRQLQAPLAQTALSRANDEDGLMEVVVKVMQDIDDKHRDELLGI